MRPPVTQETNTASRPRPDSGARAGGRLGGYDDVNDADRLGRDPAMRWIVGGKAIERQAASTSQMGRFETELLATRTLKPWPT